jgi:hypothetical protein
MIGRIFGFRLRLQGSGFGQGSGSERSTKNQPLAIRNSSDFCDSPVPGLCRNGDWNQKKGSLAAPLLIVARARSLEQEPNRNATVESRVEDIPHLVPRVLIA